MRELLILLLAALAVGPAVSQDLPKITRFVSDQLIRINISVDSSKSLTCPNKEGFIGVTDRFNKYFSASPSFIVDLGYSRGNIYSLQEMREKRLGAYHCLYQSSGNVDSHTFVVTELPEFEQISTGDVLRIGPGPTEDTFNPFCRISENNANTNWEIYKDNTGLFDEYTTGQMLSVTYTALSREHGSGMTIFRCFDRANPERIQYAWAMYSQTLQVRPVRISNYETTPLPYNVRYQNKISLECHGNGSTTSTRQPTWMFKPEGSDTYVPVVQEPRALEINLMTALSTLTIFSMLPKYSGYYKCDKDFINHIVQLKLNYGDVSIKEFSKLTFPLKQSNSITCLIPQKTLKEETTFTLYRTGMPPLVLKGATSADGFTTSFNSQDDFVISFEKRSDVENARLVCSFYGSSDYTTIKNLLPTLTLRDYQSKPKYISTLCNKSIDYGSEMDLFAHFLNPDGTLGANLRPLKSNKPNERRFFNQINETQYYEIVCVSMYNGQQLRSNILTFGTPNVKLDIIVEGERNPPKRVFLGGRDVNLECQFIRFPSTRFILPSAVSLFKDEIKLSLPQEQVNSSTFRYVLRNAGSSDNGIYRCNYANNVLSRTAQALTGTFSSPNSNLEFCSGSQFVCDMTCKDATLMCDKKRDCADGSDERPEYCEKCEPNEVKCDNHNGRAPEKRCVLKHWLCDGQDDCGNGYDENLTLHSKWCYKERECRSCRSEETCCPNTPDKCIQRNYECDKESDCDGGSEELTCSPSQCLRITDPVSRQVLNRRVGESLRMSCTAVGMDRPTINWRRNWAAIPKDGVSESNEVVRREISGDYTIKGTLDFDRLTKEMSGIYNCEAVNNCKRELSYEIELRVSDEL